MSKPPVIRIDCLALADALGPIASPGSVLVQPDASDRSLTGSFFALAAGPPSQVDSHEAASSSSLRTISLPRHVLVPGMVNAHTHLDLTHIGPHPHDPNAGFVPWIDLIRSRRHSEPDQIAASVRRGVELSVESGVVAIGDIAGAVRARPSADPVRAFMDSHIRGVSFIEFFGIGTTSNLGPTTACEVSAHFKPTPYSRVGLQPHAPNTVALSGYRAVADFARSCGAPLCTHLAETPEERQFVATGAGPQRQLLERVGVWQDSILDQLGRGQHPVEHLEPVLRNHPMLVVHLNDLTDRAIDILAGARSTVVYCPHASEYFGADRHFGPHRYRDLLKAGVPVVLGTDSIVNLPEGNNLSILEEMRLLFRRDRTSPSVLLAMGTTIAAQALLGSDNGFLFPREPAAGLARKLFGLLAIETSGLPFALNADNCLEAILSVRSSYKLLCASKLCDSTGTSVDARDTYSCQRRFDFGI